MDMIYWDHYYNTILLLNLLLVIGLFTSLRLFSGMIAHIDASDELLRKDNPAFGISLAGATFAITIMLSGAIYGSPENGVFHAIIAVGIFGVLGIGLMALTRLILAKVTLRDISMRDEIVKGNKAVAIADAGNVLAAAIIIRTVMIWVDVNSVEGIMALLGGYAVSQVILTSMTLLRIKVFGLVNKGNGLPDQLKNGNVALALRFAGQKIGTAFAIATAAQIVVYEEYDVASILVAWFVASIVVILVWKVLCFVAERIILFRVDVNQEVLEQRNIAVGALQAVIYISLGLLLSAL
ncbi:MAG: DUF350 domain-containing protein [Micavibrio sp.]